MADRVAVVGNCQAPPIAEILAKMNPSVVVDAFPYTQLRSFEAIHAAVQQLKSYDLILTQNIERPAFGPISPARIKEVHPNVLDFPAILFNGFHPDFIIIEGQSKQFVSAAGYCHSLIVASCFMEGVRIDQVKRLFNPFIFKILGYFGAFEKAKQYLLLKSGEIGYDLTEEFARWEAMGRFMYTTNHPTVPVLISMAGLIARKAGLSVAAVNENEIDDGMALQQILPVYPRIARRLGMPGDYEFKERIVQNSRGTYGLIEFIIRTYELYEHAPQVAFQHRAFQHTAELIREHLPRTRNSAPAEQAISG